MGLIGTLHLRTLGSSLFLQLMLIPLQAQDLSLARLLTMAQSDTLITRQRSHPGTQNEAHGHQHL
jgi:hypothetical protein